MGRNFSGRNQPGKDAVTIITHSLWQRRFGGDPNIVNKTITLNSITRTVVGLCRSVSTFRRAPRSMPVSDDAGTGGAVASHSYYVIGRLRQAFPAKRASRYRHHNRTTGEAISRNTNTDWAPPSIQSLQTPSANTTQRCG